MTSVYSGPITATAADYLVLVDGHRHSKLDSSKGKKVLHSCVSISEDKDEASSIDCYSDWEEISVDDNFRLFTRPNSKKIVSVQSNGVTKFRIVEYQMGQSTEPSPCANR